MNTELTYDQVLELLPAYVLGALEPEEMLAVDSYLSNNRVLLDRLHQAELAAAQLAHTTPDTPLPANAKSRLMTRLHADLSTSDPQAAAPKVEQTLLLAEPTPRVPREPTSAPKAPEDWWAGFRRIFGSAKLWATAAGCAVIALVILGVYLNRLQTQLGVMQAETNRLQARITELQQQVQNDHDLLALITDTNLERIVQLPGTKEAPEASGAFYLSNNRQAVLILRGLQPLPSAKTYQLWLIPVDGPPAPAGLLTVQANGPTWLKLPIPPNAPDFAAIGVSVEPAGGSLAPTGPIVLLGTVS